LTGRQQVIKFCDEVSHAINVHLGVPQGSVLGPLLFILYINDMKSALKHATLNLFADDTLLYVAATNLEDAVRMINEDLCTLSDWLNINKLKLNVQKTKCMVITFKKNLLKNQHKVKIDGEELEYVDNIKYLGILIDDRLKFNKNVEQLEKKNSKKN
jgi:Reverse transcriptase (RNA-dependent DNA polymerase)